MKRCQRLLTVMDLRHCITVSCQHLYFQVSEGKIILNDEDAVQRIVPFNRHCG